MVHAWYMRGTSHIQAWGKRGGRVFRGRARRPPFSTLRFVAIFQRVAVTIYGVLAESDDLLSLALSSRGGEGNGAAASEHQDACWEQPLVGRRRSKSVFPVPASRGASASSHEFRCGFAGPGWDPPARLRIPGGRTNRASGGRSVPRAWAPGRKAPSAARRPANSRCTVWPERGR